MDQTSITIYFCIWQQIINGVQRYRTSITIYFCIWQQIINGVQWYSHKEQYTTVGWNFQLQGCNGLCRGATAKKIPRKLNQWRWSWGYIVYNESMTTQPWGLGVISLGALWSRCWLQLIKVSVEILKTIKLKLSARNKETRGVKISATRMLAI
jgi:hypothetical protein